MRANYWRKWQATDLPHERREVMAEGIIDWNSPGNYDPLWVGIGLMLFALLFADFVWIYFRHSKKEVNKVLKKINTYKNNKFWEYSRSEAGSK